MAAFDVLMLNETMGQVAVAVAIKTYDVLAVSSKVHTKCHFVLTFRCPDITSFSHLTLRVSDDPNSITRDHAGFVIF